MSLRPVACCLLLLTAAPSQDSPSSVLPESKRFTRRVIASGLASPWEITWGPDNMLWVTERTGKRITRVDPATGQRTVALTIEEVSAPGGQDGLLGLALHPDLLKGKGRDFVYAAYTYADHSKGPNAARPDPKDPYHFLYAKVVRLTYNAATGQLSRPVNLITGLPAGNDHVAGRLKIGPDLKLYLTLGDGGNNQLGNFCQPVQAQRLPTKAELQRKVYVAYVGKSLRLNLDGSIPQDNPKLAGVQSHVYTYGHRNTQGIDFAPDGTLYASEHGPKTDDEVNILKSGANYGWPHVAGLRDNNAYEYARWAEATTPCSQLNFSDLAIHPSVPRQPESAFQQPFTEPIATLFTVPTGFNFANPACAGVNFVCWPTVGASSIEYYAAGPQGIPGWDQVVFVTAMKRGSLYVVPLTPDGQKKNGFIARYFQAEDRYRDTAVSPDRRTIYIATDSAGMVETLSGGATSKMKTPGAIVAFTYEGEGAPVKPQAPTLTTSSEPVNTNATPGGAAANLRPAPFTAAQAAAGRTVYNAKCAVCHGNTLTNGTFGPPLGGEQFKKTWHGRPVGAFFTKTKTMPPAAPASLDDETYSSIVAYILEVNGLPPGTTKLPSTSDALNGLSIR